MMTKGESTDCSAGSSTRRLMTTSKRVDGEGCPRQERREGGGVEFSLILKDLSDSPAEVSQLRRSRNMGRVKLKIKRLENTSGRQITYSKRRAGILKKAKELSILCDIDIVILMFSPTGKPTLCLGERRMLESLEVLKKTFKKLDHDVDIQDFLGTRYGYWTDPDNITNIDHIRAMEESLKDSLSRIQMQKENLSKQQLVPLEITTQFHSGIHVPLGMFGEQQPQPNSWLHGNNG
ncbi:MADS-box transcription factor 29 [Acorus calamus]|uniref:MADS-box transcription factor 29 n=1 Tax=Acorus calamus TaxID=4465 RepID=A0AAV9CKX8_ACOCL|nr:MADS-box transcription factor 29 [Acorus calamus]